MFKYFLMICLIVTNVSFAAFTRTPEFGNDESTNVIAWADHNADGYPDLAVGNSNPSPTNRLYTNNGAGGFTMTTPFGDMETYTMAWGDYDNDGLPDLSVGNHLGQDFLYENEGAGVFTPYAHFTSSDYPNTMSWSDYDLDADIDLALGNWNNGQNYLYENLGSTNFSYHLEFGLEDTFGMHWGDFDTDGDIDIAVINGDVYAQSYYYQNEGGGVFTVFSEFGTGADNDQAGACGDYDNDGDLDIAVAGYGGTLSKLYTNNGPADFSSSEPFEDNSGIYNMCLNWGDYDNDGDLDLAMGSNDSWQTRLYTNQGGGTFVESNLPSSTEYTSSLAWADYDRDGDLDLAVSDIYGQNYLYVNDQNDTNDDEYLSVHVVGDGVTTNSQGIGAYVKIYQPGHAGQPAYFLYYRQVGSNNSGGQNYIDPFFGIPGYSEVDVVVGWPSNGRFFVEEYWANVGVGGEFEAVQGEGSPLGINEDDIPNKPCGFYLSPPIPNPNDGSAIISYLLPEACTVALGLFDVKGRKIDTLADGDYEPGEYSTSIRGLASGLYFYKLEAGTYSDVKKLVVK